MLPSRCLVERCLGLIHQEQAGKGATQVPQWMADHNDVAPHSALGFRSPVQCRSLMRLTAACA